MDIYKRLQTATETTLQCVDMHTTGESVRIVLRGIPEIQATPLLEQQQIFKSDALDRIRRQLMREPRGHKEMFGVVLRPKTERTASGEADMGCLFMHHSGYEDMCGHSTVALGRFLVDTWDEDVFPGRRKLVFDAERKLTILRLHVPAGIVRVEVPSTDDGRAVDTSRKIAFFSVPSFATAIELQIDIPSEMQQESHEGVLVDISYGGNFFVVVQAANLGFPDGLKDVDLVQLDCAAKALKDLIIAGPQYRGYFKKPDEDVVSERQFSVIVVHRDPAGNCTPEKGTDGSEMGICFFGNQQIDRSPTGSSVAARMALAHARKQRKLAQKWTYHSLVSASHGQGAFVAEVAEEIEVRGAGNGRGVVVRIEGEAFYTGSVSFVIEAGDQISREGFYLDELPSRI
ncbi:proline racemase [Phlyctema vagabunda]|uniref:trans-L-3-hydroxyproline dehydratase n=1 Tax=Phlyctema vagabunda TaxID=108571 RepID=A0ABR4PHD7_9HELO